MKVLGIYFGRVSSSAVFKDKKIIFASSEERYTNKKSDESYPFNSINNALKFYKIKPKDLDKVVIASKALPLIPIIIRSYSGFSVKDHLLVMEKYWRPKLAGKKHKKLTELFKTKIKNDVFTFNGQSNNFTVPKVDHADWSEQYVKKVSEFYKNLICRHRY